MYLSSIIHYHHHHHHHIEARVRSPMSKTPQVLISMSRGKSRLGFLNLFPQPSSFDLPRLKALSLRVADHATWMFSMFQHMPVSTIVYIQTSETCREIGARSELCCLVPTVHRSGAVSCLRSSPVRPSGSQAESQMVYASAYPI